MEILDPRLKLKLFSSTNTGKKYLHVQQMPWEQRDTTKLISDFYYHRRTGVSCELASIDGIFVHKQRAISTLAMPYHHIPRTEAQCGVIRYQNHTLFGAVGKRRLLFICIGHFHRSCQNKKRDKIKYKRKVPPSSTAATTARPVWTDTIYHQLTKRKCGLPVWLISLGQRGTYAA